MRRLAAAGGYVVVADEAVSNESAAAGNEINWLLYGSSALVCLPIERPHDTGRRVAARRLWL